MNTNRIIGAALTLMRHLILIGGDACRMVNAWSPTNTRAMRRVRRARYVPVTRPVWSHSWNVPDYSRHADARRESRASHARALLTRATYAREYYVCDTCHAPMSLGSDCTHEGYVPRAPRVRLTRDARTLVRLMRDTLAREAHAALADARNRNRAEHTDSLSTRAARARARYLASLTPAERDRLAALQAAPIEAVDRTAERYARGWDSEPMRGVTSAREARVRERGAGDAAYGRMSGHAARVTSRDAHGSLDSAPYTLSHIETVGYSTHPALTRENHATLLDSVRRDPSRATLTRTMPGPHGRMVTRGVPVTNYTAQRDAARDAAREAQRARREAQRARVAHATRPDAQAARRERVARALSIAGTHTASDTDA